MSNIDGPEYVRQENRVEPVADVLPPPVVAPVVAPGVVTQGVAGQPYVAQGAVPQHVVVQEVVAQPVGSVRTAYSRRFAPDAMIAAAVGLVLLVVGLLAIIRGGFDGSMEQPIVEVLGFTHTTTLGLIEVVLGALLLLSGASSWRSGSMFFGSVLAIGGFVGAVQTESFVDSLALESSHAWLAVGAGIVVVLSALLMPRYVSRSTTVHPI